VIVRTTKSKRGFVLIENISSSSSSNRELFHFGRELQINVGLFSL
jgi:hypothetical protein